MQSRILGQGSADNENGKKRLRSGEKKNTNAEISRQKVNLQTRKQNIQSEHEILTERKCLNKK